MHEETLYAVECPCSLVYYLKPGFARECPFCGAPLCVPSPYLAQVAATIEGDFDAVAETFCEVLAEAFPGESVNDEEIYF